MSTIFNRLVGFNCSYFSVAREVSLFLLFYLFKISNLCKVFISHLIFENTAPSRTLLYLIRVDDLSNISRHSLPRQKILFFLFPNYSSLYSHFFYLILTCLLSFIKWFHSSDVDYLFKIIALHFNGAVFINLNDFIRSLVLKII